MTMTTALRHSYFPPAHRPIPHRPTPVRHIDRQTNTKYVDKATLTRQTAAVTAKRKSAVELLQETKAFYVKSEVVLDRKQEFQPSVVRTSRSPEYGYIGGPKSPKSTELQDKLRLLLSADLSQNIDRYSETKSVFGSVRPYKNTTIDRELQHKSLPDLHSSHSSTDTSESSYGLQNRSIGDARSSYSTITHKSQPEFSSLQTRRSFTPHQQSIYGSLRVTKSGELLTPRLNDGYLRRNSNTSSANHSQHNSNTSKHSQSADSGRLSQVGSVGLRTGRSGLPETLSPPPADTASDSGAEEGSPPLYSNSSSHKRRVILRSKSDISHRYYMRPALSIPPPLLMTCQQLEMFFDHLGMDPLDYREVCGTRSETSSPVFFSSVSSLDSYLEPPWPGVDVDRPTEPTSVVERNARIIKWLFNCRKSQVQGLTLV